jgi:Hsp20/alpha crystallin family protein
MSIFGASMSEPNPATGERREKSSDTLADGVLTIRGEKKSERDEQDKDKSWHVVERSYGSFSRTISLPFDPDPAEVAARASEMSASI